MNRSKKITEWVYSTGDGATIKVAVRMVFQLGRTVFLVRDGNLGLNLSHADINELKKLTDVEMEKQKVRLDWTPHLTLEFDGDIDTDYGEEDKHEEINHRLELSALEIGRRPDGTHVYRDRYHRLREGMPDEHTRGDRHHPDSTCVLVAATPENKRQIQLLFELYALLATKLHKIFNPQGKKKLDKIQALHQAIKSVKV